jgi:hypothetical protein
VNVYERRNAILGAEFDRYVREHSSFASRIPRGAQIVLQVPDDPKFSAWARRLAKRQREAGQPVVLITVQRVRPAKSRLVSPRMEIEAA